MSEFNTQDILDTTDDRIIPLTNVLEEVRAALQNDLPMLTGGEVEEEGLFYPHPDAPDVYSIFITFNNDGINEGYNIVLVGLVNNGGLVCEVTQGLVSGKTAIQQIIHSLSVVIPLVNDHIVTLQGATS